jgi:hypothetical protein
MGMTLIGHLMRMRNETWSFSKAAYQIAAFSCTLVPALLEMNVLLRLDFGLGRITRRPLTKKEKLSRRIDKRLGWAPPLLVSDSVSLL